MSSHFLLALGVALLALPLGVGCGGPSHAQQGEALFGGRPRGEFLFDRDVFLSAMEPPSAPAAQVSTFHAQEEVLGVLVGNAARAYPVSLLAQHHAVNDVLGGTPIVVTYCILCSSGVVFDPTIDGRRLTFGVDGAWRGTATLYDHQTESIWMQVSGACISGKLAGRSLRPLLGCRHTTWGEWLGAHPNTELMLPLSQEQGGLHPDRYQTGGRSTVGSPFVPDEIAPLMPPPEDPPRLGPHDVVVGVVIDGLARAYAAQALEEVRVVEERIGGTDASVWLHPPSGAAVGFDRRLRNRALSFAMDERGVVRDTQTGSRWSLDGTCVEGALRGERLRPLHSLRAEWYGWRSHHAETSLWLHPRHAE